MKIDRLPYQEAANRFERIDAGMNASDWHSDMSDTKIDRPPTLTTKPQNPLRALRLA